MALRVKLIYLADFRILFGNEDPSVALPAGLMYLKEYAEINSADPSALDISIHTYRSGDSVGDIVASIDPASTDVLGISCYFWNLERSYAVAAQAKIINRAITIIMGGPESEETEDILKKQKFIDVCVRGEGEEVLRDILDSLAAGNGVPRAKGITLRDGKTVVDCGGRGIVKDLNSLPSIYTDGFVASFEGGELYYHTERGCFCKCRYCTLGPPLRFRDINVVEAELTRLLAIKNATYLNIWDSDLTWDLERFKSILRIVEKNNIHKRKISINYGFLSCDDETLTLLGRNIDRIVMGFQSTNQDVIESAGRKVYNLEKRAAALEKAFEFISPTIICAQFIFGLPGDNYAALGCSMKWAQSMGLTDVWVVQNLALPGTEYRRTAKKYGIVFKKKPFYNVECTSTYSRAEMKKSKSTLFWFTGLMKLFKSPGLRQLAGNGVYLWDIAEKFPYADPSMIADNLEGGDIFEFLLKVTRFERIRGICYKLLRETAKKDNAAREALGLASLDPIVK